MILFFIAFLFYVMPVILSVIIFYVELKEQHERGTDITFFEILITIGVSFMPILNIYWVFDNSYVLYNVINLDFTVIKGKKND